MQCNKCNEVFELKSQPSKLYWMSEIEELRYKSEKFIKEMGYVWHEYGGVHYIEVSDTKKFFVENYHHIRKNFTQMESEANRL